MCNELDVMQVLTDVLDYQLLTHPLPWTINHDWTCEVLASDGAIIAKCMKESQAQAVIDYAQKRRAELDEACAEAEELIQHIVSS